MANNYFRFKQFTVWHDRAAMKVGTDGVLIGAWCQTAQAQKALDIGTGSGLIALMLAQRSSASIHAIDNDRSSCYQAAENVHYSPWQDRIKVFHTSLQEFLEYNYEQYDLIVTNPPYFSNATPNASPIKTNARHHHTLTPEELAKSLRQLLHPLGKFSLIMPPENMESFKRLMQTEGFFLSRLTYVKPTENKPVKRILLEFRKQKIPTEEYTLYIRQNHQFTDDYIALTQGFYLDF